MTASTLPGNSILVDTSDRLSFTLFIAIILHAIIILGINFTVDRNQEIAPTLEITLATHSSLKVPEQADYLAQLNQEASGTEESAKELSTDRRAEIADTQINEVSPQPQVRATTPTERQTQIVTTLGQNQNKASSEIDPLESQEVLQRDGELENTPVFSAEITSLQAKLDQQRQLNAKRPRIRRLTSVATKASYDAEYLNQWSSKIELAGKKNYPQEALRKHIFGNLRLVVVILPNGTIEKVEILHSSGFPILDAAAKQIVHLASPFAPFPTAIRKEVDQLEIIRTWRFEITGLRTTN